MTSIPVERKLSNLLKTPMDYPSAQRIIVETLRETFSLSRVNILLYNKSKEMLEAISSVGHPQQDFRDIRTPLLNIPGISARAVQSRSFLQNRSFVIRDRDKDPEYRMRHKFPHKTYSREFAIFPLTLGKRRLGVLSIAVDENNPTLLAPPLIRKVGRLCRLVTKVILSTIPKIPSEGEMQTIIKEILHTSKLYNVFQPIVDIEKSEIHAYESLLRVSHPKVPDVTTLLNYAEKLNELRDLSHFSHYNTVQSLKNLRAARKCSLI